MAGTGHGVDFEVTASGVQIIDAVLAGSVWTDTTVTFSFPDSGSDYIDYDTSEPDGVIPLTALMKSAARFVLDKDDGNSANDGFSIEGFTALTVDFVTSTGAHLRLAQTSEDPFGYNTAWGGNPWWNPEAGDVWFHTEVYDYTNPKPGAHNWRTHLHELGHAMGLKHGHADEGTGFGTLPEGMDSYEYSVMTYRSHPGADLATHYGEWSAPQSYMIADIAALQYLYGADYDTNAGNTTYTWTPGSADTQVDGAVAISPGGDVILATIWDGGGIDTYDLSAYSSALMLDLRPGEHSRFSEAQRAWLGDDYYARGNIFNALLFEGDKRSLIENATGGSGNDKITGNEAANKLLGGAGRDLLKGLEGKDLLKGGGGKDKLLGGSGTDQLDGGKGRDQMTGGGGKDKFVFKKGYGKDTIKDFQDDKDTIQLDDALWNGSFNKQKVINKFAEVVGDDIIFDFGKHELKIKSFSDLTELKDDLDFI
ncbi:MAG: M10 family metallopeptidase C-terminal domain-containing protein [Rhodobacteraceae bacterium]|nr:M10 family metallopeptidase C-terminal domain-containing protein [Paracoccaceae bacterium]